MSFIFDAATGRYRDTASGRLVSEAAVRTAVDRVADSASLRLGALTERLAADEILLSEWQLEAMRTIRQAHVAAGVAAHGGRAQMTPARWGYIGHRIRTEYRYLRTFAGQVHSGAQPLTPGVVARARMYGQGTRVTFEAIRARDDAGRGYEEERSVLHPAEHCAQCIAEAARGWVALGTIAPIGSRTCMAMCRCTITRRMAPQQRARHLRAVG